MARTDGARMKQVRVELGDRSYTVSVGVGVADALPALLCTRAPHRVLLVSDAGVPQYFRRRLLAQLAAAGLEALEETLPGGEEVKTLDTVGRLCDRLLEIGADRSSAMVCLGGGAIGDVGALAASLFMRGIACVHVPTTLLAMVDSSIGGKTAVNRPGTKNAAGTFHQPVAVFADLEYLATLPVRDRRAALAEVVKYGVALDEGLLNLVESRADDLLEMDTALLEEVVTRCVALKAGIVSRDERETGGERQVLNYGHTAGHAIEAVAAGALLHGEAVSVGMTVAAGLAMRTGRANAALGERQTRILARLGLPLLAPGLALDDVMAALGRDKKSGGGEVGWVLPLDAGRSERGVAVPLATVREEIGRVVGAGTGSAPGHPVS